MGQITFKSIDDVKKEFQIESSSIEELRKKLRKLIKLIHPDHQQNEGEFKSQVDRDHFNKILEAMEFLDELPLTPMISPDKKISVTTDSDKEIKEMSNNEIKKYCDDLTREVTLLKEQKNKSEESKNKQDFFNLMNTQISSAKSLHNFPKFSLTVVTSIVSLLWLFPSSVQNHPILSNLIKVNSPYFSIIWLFMMILTIEWWIIYYQIEKLQTKIFTRFNDESFQNEIFDDFIEDERMIGESAFPLSDFTKTVYMVVRYKFIRRRQSANFVFAISVPFSIRWIMSFIELESVIDQEIVNGFSKIVLSRAEHSGIITRVVTGYLGDVYEFNTLNS